MCINNAFSPMSFALYVIQHVSDVCNVGIIRLIGSMPRVFSDVYYCNTNQSFGAHCQLPQLCCIFISHFYMSKSYGLKSRWLNKFIKDKQICFYSVTLRYEPISVALPFELREWVLTWMCVVCVFVCVRGWWVWGRLTIQWYRSIKDCSIHHSIVVECRRLQWFTPASYLYSILSIYPYHICHNVLVRYSRLYHFLAKKLHISVPE